MNFQSMENWADTVEGQASSIVALRLITMLHTRRINLTVFLRDISYTQIPGGSESGEDAVEFQKLRMLSEKKN